MKTYGAVQFSADLRALLAESSPGPFLWGPTEDRAAFLVENERLTDEHGDAQARGWVVQTTDEADPVTVAYSGHGPRAHHNAELIAFLLNNAAEIGTRLESPAIVPDFNVWDALKGHRIKGLPDEGEWSCTCHEETDLQSAEEHIGTVVIGAYERAARE